MIDHKTDYVETAVGNDLYQWRNSPNRIAYLKVFASLFQDIEDAAQEMLVLRSIEQGEGIQLDIIGVMVGRGRSGFPDDATYKIGLRTQVRINRSSGEIRDFEDVLEISVPSLSYALDEPSVCRIRVTIITPITLAERNAIFANLRQTKALGIKLELLATISPAVNPFIWGSIGDIDLTNTVDGFSTIALTTGGAWDSLISI